MRIYIASPLGFADSTRAFIAEIAAVLQDCGHEPIDPWALPEGEEIVAAARLPAGGDRRAALHEANMRVAAANATALRSCEGLLAVLDGADVDSGTASEAGYAFGLGKRIDGLRTDFRRAGENEAAIVNLQVQYWIEASGGGIVTSLAALRDHLQASKP